MHWIIQMTRQLSIWCNEIINTIELMNVNIPIIVNPKACITLRRILFLNACAPRCVYLIGLCIDVRSIWFTACPVSVFGVSSI